ncbi:transposase [Bradyrhizobium sp. GM7.3]
MTKIGEDVSQRLDVIPAQWRVLVTRRPKYICRRCSGPVVQAHAPEHVVPGGLPTEAAIAHVIVSKFGDHTPFYRQAAIYARQGIRLDRATLGNWSGRACFHLQPIADHMRHHLAMADRLFMDETKAPVLDPGRGQTKKGYFWAIASDDRGHSGASPPIVLFRYAPGRSGAFAEQFLDGFGGRYLQCDAYDGYDRLNEVVRPQGPWTLVHCWSHLRRRFVKLVRNSKSPIAEAAVRHIAQLYAIEAMVRGSSPDIRLAARKEHSLPMVAALKSWFEKQLSMISSGSTLAEDIRYALNHWQGLTRFLEDGRLELDTNPVENAIRPVCLTRKNALFAGHETGAENWALLASIVATCKLNESIRPPTSPKHSRRSSTAIPIAESATSCRGASARRQARLNRAPAERLLPRRCRPPFRFDLAQRRGVLAGWFSGIGQAAWSIWNRDFDLFSSSAVAVGMWATRLRCPSAAACPQRHGLRSFGRIVRRRLSPVRSSRWALWTRRSSTASA